jgi:hypothetical protein
MQIEQLASMPTELPPPTTTTIADAAAAAPRIYSFRSLLKAKWRTRGALILYAAVGLTLLGCKMFWPEPHKADASAAVAPAVMTKKPVAKTQAVAKSKPANVAPAAAMAEAPAGGGGTGGDEKSPAVATTAARKPTTAPARTARRTAASAPADLLGALYIDEANGFSIRFPAGWSLRTFDGDPWVIDAGDGRVGLISVGFAPFPEAFTAESIPPDWIAKKIKRRADTTLHGQGYAVVSGRKALWSKSTGPLPMTHAAPRMTRVNYILPLGDGRVLELRVAASPEQFDRLVPVMRKAVETFALQTPQRRERGPVASAQ